MDQPIRSSAEGGSRPALRGLGDRWAGNAILGFLSDLMFPDLQFHHPHLLYPQFKQVAHPSIMMVALVLHLWHIVAPGGNALPPSASEDSSSPSRRLFSPRAPARSSEISTFGSALGLRLISGFFLSRRPRAIRTRRVSRRSACAVRCSFPDRAAGRSSSGAVR